MIPPEAKKLLDSFDPAPKQPSILDRANTAIHGERNKNYGDASDNLGLTADYWSAHINLAKSVKISLTADDVCTMMVLLKAARLAYTPNHLDSQVDICGYTALMEQMQTRAADEKQMLAAQDTAAGIPSDQVFTGATDAKSWQIETQGRMFAVTPYEYKQWLTCGKLPERIQMQVA